MALLGAQFVNAVSPNPVGSLQAYAGASAPTGWLLCDGTSYSTTVYPELFNVLGYTYGGDPPQNFLVPDLRGRVPMGAGTGDGLTARSLGDEVGTETHTLTTAQMPSHNHNVQENSSNGTILGGHFTPGGSSYAGNIGSSAAPVFVTNTGGGGSHPNVQPSLVTNYIIKAVPDAPRSGLAYGSTPPIVTALPANPQFGDVVTYIADAANGVAWNLQYDATGTYPWKFIGGSALVAQVDTDEGIVAGTTTYTALATAGPSITLARAGDYVISQGCRGYPFANNQSLHMSYDIGATPASDSDSVLLDCASGLGENGSRTKLKTGISANSAIVSKYKHTSSGAAANFAYRWMTVTPVRVSA